MLVVGREGNHTPNAHTTQQTRKNSCRLGVSINQSVFIIRKLITREGIQALFRLLLRCLRTRSVEEPSLEFVSEFADGS